MKLSRSDGRGVTRKTQIEKLQPRNAGGREDE